MNSKINTSVALLSALTISLVLGAASTSVAQTKQATTQAAQTVTIAAKRLSPAQKAAYDQEQANHNVQTVIISAKRLSPQAKVAFDKANASSFQANAQFNKTLRQTV